jgi:hypothetical protein
MKGENKMTFNPSYAELLGKELERNRMREAERERLIHKATAWKPPLRRKVYVILRARWEDFWQTKKYPPISQVPKKSTSI